MWRGGVAGIKNHLELPGQRYLPSVSRQHGLPRMLLLRGEKRHGVLLVRPHSSHLTQRARRRTAAFPAFVALHRFRKSGARPHMMPGVSVPIVRQLS